MKKSKGGKEKDGSKLKTKGGVSKGSGSKKQGSKGSFVQQAAVKTSVKVDTSGPLPLGAKVMCRWKDGSEQQLCELLEMRTSPSGKREYYVHYSAFNRRMDEWVKEASFDLETLFTDEMDPEHDTEKVRQARSLKKKHDEMNAVLKAHENIDEEAEKEHEEVTKVKNINTIVLGKYEVDTWYFSPYPEEYSNLDKLYTCEFCLKYMNNPRTYERHQSKCTMRHPPGDEIYRHQDPSSKYQLSVFEVDGVKHKTYCQNLCLIAKLFLDHKTLYYDVDPFLFYIICEVDEKGCHIVSYFSKEKESIDNYNLACILTLPPHQRKGYGKFMMSLSYEISLKEGKVGSPEKPLSDLGLLSYRSYWSEVIIELLSKHKGAISIKDISAMTAMKPEDITSTMQFLGLIRYWKGQHIISVSQKVIDDHQKAMAKVGPRCNPEWLHWAPQTMPTVRRRPMV